jgi:hypothetical protein
MKNFFNRLSGRVDPPSDRRRSPRYPASPNRVCLAWQDKSWTREMPARLLNVSGEGALVTADEMSDGIRTLWLRLEEPTSTEWFEASVVRRGKSGEVGLAFAVRCPSALFRAATSASR